MLAQQRAQRAQPPPAKKKVQGSARGSEERQTSVSAAPPRGQKRVRDQDLEKVRTLHSNCMKSPDLLCTGGVVPEQACC
jgi:mortality factor 4-like protein 1